MTRTNALPPPLAKDASLIDGAKWKLARAQFKPTFSIDDKNRCKKDAGSVKVDKDGPYVVCPDPKHGRQNLRAEIWAPELVDRSEDIAAAKEHLRTVEETEGRGEKE